MGSSDEIIFYNKGGRPRVLSKKEAHKAKLEAKKRWRDKNKERTTLYNEMYRSKSKKSKHSKKKSKKESRKSSRKGSKHKKSLQYGGHTVTLLKVNSDGSRIVLVK
ncbi:hypothetical protein Indivirus_5_23 [Indivirus ILV1]|uniref:Uncharacterized protein n=1 Tax=Indivirus ILV1 TaxID=1977633 RepID=A0A1V0SDU6_9VIRU|nr:hypothetical protein Indivirus_5_23 [Indivirus ILV1]